MSVLSTGAVRRSICSAWVTLWRQKWQRARLPPQAATGPFRPSADGHLPATGATSGLCAESSQPYRRHPGRARTGTGLPTMMHVAFSGVDEALMSVLSAGAVRRSICSVWVTLWRPGDAQAATGPFRGWPLTRRRDERAVRGVQPAVPASPWPGPYWHWAKWASDQ